MSARSLLPKKKQSEEKFKTDVLSAVFLVCVACSGFDIFYILAHRRSVT